MKRAFLAIVLTIPLTGLCQEHLPLPEQVVVTSVGTEPHTMTEACSGFTLNKEQVLAYFKTTIIIDAFEEHDHYAWAPCWVRGTAIVKKQQVHWEIRAGLTARIVFSNGEVVLLADPTQRFSEED